MQLENLFNYLWITTEAWLALGEIERDQGHEAKARLAFRSAKKAFDRMADFAQQKKLYQLPIDDLRLRVRQALILLPSAN
jgi:hypothetical protein